MEKDIQKSLEIYKEQLSYGYVQTAYLTLMKYVAELKAKFPKVYHTTNIGLGYLDYTYFYFKNDYISNKNLKFALVLNHEKMQFELWLCARTAVGQKQYWKLLKNSPWNQNRVEMPKYSVLEVILEKNINFDDKETMTKNILNRSYSLATEIQEYLQRIDD